MDYQQQRLTHAMDKRLGESRQQLGRLAASLDAMSPFRVLSRGYAIASLAQPDGETVLSSVGQVEAGDTLRLKVSDGVIHTHVTGKETITWQKKS